MMTSQEIFDKIVSHLRKQKRPAKSSFGRCRYLTADGLQCAVGCLIDPEEYDPRIENRDVHSVLTIIDLPNSLREKLEPHKELLNKMQRTHDNYSPCDWEVLFKDIAKTFGLSYSKLDPEKGSS